jgi:hypothetical protein
MEWAGLKETVAIRGGRCTIIVASVPRSIIQDRAAPMKTGFFAMMMPRRNGPGRASKKNADLRRNAKF